MNKLWHWCWLIGLILVVAGLSSSLSRAGSHCAGDYAPGKVLVGFRDNASAVEWQAQARRDVSTPEVMAMVPGIGVAALRAPAGQECALVNTLRRDPHVAYAELDYAVHATEVITPDDPAWLNQQQWNLSKIEAPAAWGVVTGTPDVVIAVLDTGVYLDHEDLASKLWTNPGEVPGNWVDDDGNGQVDDVHGWHFYQDCYNGSCTPYQDANVRDDNGHGTHVAGIAAAATNNGAGIAGLAWGVRIMPVKVLNQYGDGFYSDLAAGLVYAAENGARVINMSLGGVEPSQTLCAAADYASRHGALVVSATGNDGAPWVRYPAACPGVLAVAATDQNDQWATFSNYGPQVDLAAPGSDIYSTWCHQNIYLKLCDGNYYLAKSGTSMATPHVSGVAALIWSLRPGLSSSQVISRLLETSSDVDSPGPDPYTGWGRVNAYRAVADLEPLPDLWASLAGPQLIRVGEPFSYTLTYGNRGVRNAEGVTLTLEWAGGLVSSQPRRQEIGTVLADTGPYTQSWQAMLQCSTMCQGAVYTTTVTIQSATPERTSMDNTFTWIARAAWPVFFPVVLK